MIVFDGTPARTNGSSPATVEPAVSVLAEAILNEIASLLERFVATGEEGAIDLRGLPMADEDTRRLEELLGRGEVRAELDVIGRSEVWETAFNGVWWVRHRSSDDRIAAEEIVVTRFPAILATHDDDARAAAARLRAALAHLGLAQEVPGEGSMAEEETAHV